MIITYKITDADKEKYVSSTLSKNKQLAAKLLFYSGTVILALLSILALIAKDFSFAIPCIIFLIAMHLIVKSPRIIKKKYIESINSDEERTIEINKDNLVISNSSRTVIFQYSDVKSVEYVNDYFVLIKFRLGDSSVIPISAFSDKDEMITFVNKIKTNAKIL